MKVLFINSVCGIRSTGRIVTDLAQEYILNGHTCRVAYGREVAPKNYSSIAVRIGSNYDILRNALNSRIFDDDGLNAIRATKKFINWANSYDPDVLWLHNLHGYYINVELLFDWIKSRPKMKVKWTLHDCWAFTGHCAHFSFAKCEQWKNGCEKCPQLREYPATYFGGASKSNFERKKAAFCGVDNMTLICPSHWLANLVKSSFLKEYPVEVEHNKIDMNAFKPTPSDFREKNGLQDKKIILGVASSWSKRKGLDSFILLSKMLSKEYTIVLVGLSERQIRKLPKEIMGIKKTNNTTELAQIYTASDVHLVLSKEETFGMTIIEAISCHTIPIVLKGTACEEVVRYNTGYAVEDNLSEIKETIVRVCDSDSNLNL